MSCPSVPNSDYFEESVVNMDELIMQKSVRNLTMLSTMPVLEQRILKKLAICIVQGSTQWNYSCTMGYCLCQSYLSLYWALGRSGSP
jgi:hypothetical protein